MFQQLVEAIHDHAIYMLSPDGTVMTWNAGAERIKGYTAEEIIGRSFNCFFPADAVAKGLPQASLSDARQNGRYCGEGWRLRKDGSRFWARVSISAIRAVNGPLIGFAKVTEDLTRQRELEAMRQERDRAEAADRAKSRFLANVSHELRTPLNAILGFTQLVRMKAADQLGPQILEYLGYIERSGESLRDLIEDVLDLSKIDQGKISLNIEAVDITGLFELMRLETVQQIARRKQTLSLSPVPPGLTVQADRGRLGQVLLNFISNANKYAREGDQIELACRRLDDGRIELAVSDNGPGIAEARQGELFQPFQRLGFEGSNIEGTGIGLSIAKQLTEAMGGEIGFTSKVGQGARFYVRLPVSMCAQCSPLELTQS